MGIVGGDDDSWSLMSTQQMFSYIEIDTLCWFLPEFDDPCNL